MNEHNVLTEVDIKYEWKPTICGVCKMVGHQDTECRKGTKRVWVQKQQVQPMIHTPVVDQDGFQRALKPIRVRSSIAVPTQVTNTFQLLNADDVGTEPVRHEVESEESDLGRRDPSQSYG